MTAPLAISMAALVAVDNDDPFERMSGRYAYEIGREMGWFEHMFMDFMHRSWPEDWSWPYLRTETASLAAAHARRNGCRTVLTFIPQSGLAKLTVYRVIRGAS